MHARGSHRGQLGEDLLLGIKVKVGALLTPVLLLEDLHGHIAVVPLGQVDVGELCDDGVGGVMVFVERYDGQEAWSYSWIHQI